MDEAEGRTARAARLLGAATALREAEDALLSPPRQVGQERIRATLLAAQGKEVFAAAWEEGRAMTREQSVAYALEPTVDIDCAARSDAASPPATMNDQPLPISRRTP